MYGHGLTIPAFLYRSIPTGPTPYVIKDMKRTKIWTQVIQYVK